MAAFEFKSMATFLMLTIAIPASARDLRREQVSYLIPIDSSVSGMTTASPAKPSDPCTNNNGGCMHQCALDRRTAAASCSCNSGYSLCSDGKSCLDVRYQTCSWPVKVDCDQNCEMRSESQGIGTYPQCTCNPRYILDSNGKDCIENPCTNNNGGCMQQCKFDMKTHKAICICSRRYKLHANGKSCSVKSCHGADRYTCRTNAVCTKQYDVTERRFMPFCKCATNYVLDPKTRSCIINPCTKKNGGCMHQCVLDRRTLATSCSCSSGYSLGADGKSCFRGCTVPHCTHGCDEMKGAHATCSCPDDRMILNKDGRTCAAKSCHGDNKYTCGDDAVCTRQYDARERRYMPVCKCSTYYVLDPKTRSCIRDIRYKTCDWPMKADCGQACRVRSNLRGVGTHPLCSCTRGYALDSNGKDCIVTNPCIADGMNGGCEQVCDYDQRTLAVQCSCYGDSNFLKPDAKSCVLKACRSELNSGCEQGCVEIGEKDYHCTCDIGFHLNPDEKTCLDFDECSAFHGCAHMCVSDGNHFYKCQCRPGYELDGNGFSCSAIKLSGLRSTTPTYLSM